MSDSQQIDGDHLFTIDDESGAERRARRFRSVAFMVGGLAYAGICWVLVGRWFAMLFVGVPLVIMGLALLATSRSGMRRRSPAIALLLLVAGAVLMAAGLFAVVNGKASEPGQGGVIAAQPKQTTGSDEPGAPVTHSLVPSTASADPTVASTDVAPTQTDDVGQPYPLPPRDPVAEPPVAPGQNDQPAPEPEQPEQSIPGPGTTPDTPAPEPVEPPPVDSPEPTEESRTPDPANGNESESGAETDATDSVTADGIPGTDAEAVVPVDVVIPQTVAADSGEA